MKIKFYCITLCVIFCANLFAQKGVPSVACESKDEQNKIDSTYCRFYSPNEINRNNFLLKHWIVPICMAQSDKELKKMRKGKCENKLEDQFLKGRDFSNSELLLVDSLLNSSICNDSGVPFKYDSYSKQIYPYSVKKNDMLWINLIQKGAANDSIMNIYFGGYPYLIGYIVNITERSIVRALKY